MVKALIVAGALVALWVAIQFRAAGRLDDDGWL
jgi:hypothetical protein